MTLFADIVNLAFTLITDDIFEDSLESYDEFLADGQDLLMAALPSFKFPKFNIYDIVNLGGANRFSHLLNQEERIILAQLLAIKWLDRQILTVDLIRQEVYASSDYRKTSQASHLSRLMSLKKDLAKENFASQNLYGRRKMTDAGAVSTMSVLGGGKNNG